MHGFLRRFGRCLATLLIVVVAVVPVADAFSCALESEISHAAEGLAGGDAGAHDEEASGDTLHGVCPHNHCHHTTADVPPEAAVGAIAFEGGVAAAADDAGRPASGSDGPMRPPRI
jgi:hypothetical protein